jgi:hypothetical protein
MTYQITSASSRLRIFGSWSERGIVTARTGCPRDRPPPQCLPVGRPLESDCARPTGRQRAAFSAVRALLLARASITVLFVSPSHENRFRSDLSPSLHLGYPWCSDTPLSACRAPSPPHGGAPCPAGLRQIPDPCHESIPVKPLASILPSGVGVGVLSPHSLCLFAEPRRDSAVFIGGIRGRRLRREA